MVDDGDGVGADQALAGEADAENRSGSLFRMDCTRWAMLSVSVSEVKT